MDINGDITIDFGEGTSELRVQDWGNISIDNDITITILNWTEGDIFAGANPGTNVFNVKYADTLGTIYANGTWGGGLITPDALPLPPAPAPGPTPVPEPSEYALILLGGTFFILFVRRGIGWFVRRRVGQEARSLMTAA